MRFLLSSFPSPTGLLYHSWKNGEARHPAFLDDYACLIAALVELAQVSANFDYFQEADRLTRLVLEHFSDEQTPYFFYTHKGQTDVLVRKKEMYDGATPSGNAVMAANLYRLSIVFDKREWRERSERMTRSLAEAIVKYPTSFGVWLSVLYEQISGTSEIAIVGKEWKIYHQKVMGIYISHKLAMASAHPQPGYPLLADKAGNSEILIYVCKNYACRLPVSTIQDFVTLLGAK